MVQKFQNGVRDFPSPNKRRFKPQCGVQGSGMTGRGTVGGLRRWKRVSQSGHIILLKKDGKGARKFQDHDVEGKTKNCRVHTYLSETMLGLARGAAASFTGDASLKPSTTLKNEGAFMRTRSRVRIFLLPAEASTLR